MKLPDDIFVLVLGKDVSSETEREMKSLFTEYEAQPIVIETPMCLASKRDAEGLARRWQAGGHDDIKIGRVIFGATDQVRPIDTVFDLLNHDNDQADDLIDSMAPLFGDESALIDAGARAQLQVKILEWVRAL